MRTAALQINTEPEFHSPQMGERRGRRPTVGDFPDLQFESWSEQQTFEFFDERS